MLQKSTTEESNYMMLLIVSNHSTFAMLNQFMDSIENLNPYHASFCIEYVSRLVSYDDDRLAKFQQKHKQDDLYMRMYRVAMGIRSVLMSSPKSNLSNWLADYEEDL